MAEVSHIALHCNAPNSARLGSAQLTICTGASANEVCFSSKFTRTSKASAVSARDTSLSFTKRGFDFNHF